MDDVVIAVLPNASAIVRSLETGVMTERSSPSRDGIVMTTSIASVTLGDMPTNDPVRTLVLEEFRLNDADAASAAARIISATSPGLEPAVPLLTSIEDRCDVATIRGLHAGEPTAVDMAQHAALDPLVRTWQPPRHYAARIAERSESPSSSFRLAVTESGINGERLPAVKFGRGGGAGETRGRPIGLMWVGAPVGSYAGLLILLGTYDDPPAAGAEPAAWPLPLSRGLGVRIYQSGEG